MSSDDHTKETVPPPEGHASQLGDDDSEAQERTVLADVPEELIAELQRQEEEEAEAPRPSSPGVAGLGKMFPRDADQVRDALPDASEGDALLDVLFDDAGGEPRESASPEPTPPPAGPPPAPRPAVPRPPVPPPRPGPPRPSPSSPELDAADLEDDEDLDDQATIALSGSVGLSAAQRLSAAASNAPPQEDLGATRATSPEETARLLDMEEEPTHALSPADLPRPAPAAPELETAGSPDAEAGIDAGPPPIAVIDAVIGEQRTSHGEDVDEMLQALPLIDAAAHASDEGLELAQAASEQAVDDAPPPMPPMPAAPPMPSRPPVASAFSDEREASFVLADAGSQEMFLARAAWLREEAGLQEDPVAQARMLLAVSELFAMAGEDVDAAEVAAEAHHLSTSAPLMARQHRAHTLRGGDWTAVLTALDAETRAAPTPAARCHGAWLGAEIARLCLSDQTASQKRTELSMRGMATDPRAYIERFVEVAKAPSETGAPIGLAKLRPPDNAGLPELSEAFARVALGRCASDAKTDPKSPYEAMVVARSRLEAADIAGTVAVLEEMGGVLEGGVGWLLGVLAAPQKSTRQHAAGALARVLGGSHGAQASRALAGVAIELDDATSARAAADSSEGDAFGAGDRVAMAALTGASREEVDPILQAAAHDGELGALTAATSAAVGEPDDPERRVFAVGTDHSRLATGLARVLAGVDPTTVDLVVEDAVVSAVGQLKELLPDSGVAKALALELDIEAKHAVKVAETLSSWGSGGADGGRDRGLAAALIAEVAKDADRAVEAYDMARAADRAHEGAARARASHETGADVARVLAEHAEGVDDPIRAAVLLTEAGVRLTEAGAADEAEAAYRRAAELAPTLPLALHLGERLARGSGDRDALLEWLRARREASSDPGEQAHDLVREALLVSDEDGVPAAALLEQALAARPGDVGLRDLYERLAPEPPADRAAWRAERVADAEGDEKARLAIEAALEYERIGDLASAAECAKEAIAAGDTVIAPLCAYRYAVAGHGAAELVDELLPKARASEDQNERLDIYRRLADLDELGRNDVASGLLWHRTILEEKPEDLGTLRRLSTTLIESGREDELEPIALQLAKILDGPEAIAHAVVAVRLRRRTSWDEAGEAVRAAYRLQPRGIWVLRQMSAYARANGEHELACECSQQLIDRTGRPSEVATLALRAAEEAAEAGNLEMARDLLSQAAAVAGEHLVVQLNLANVLEASGDFAAAAGQLEAAAEAAFTPTEKAEAYARAANLWHEKIEDAERARTAFERVIELDPTHLAAFDALQRIYIESGAQAELAELLERRLDSVTDPQERVEMEVMRGRALADVGDPDAAKRALAAALEANPDHFEALSAFADLCSSDEDWTGAEQALIRLARLASEPERQTDIYMRLGELYRDKLPNQERAELAYQEILKRSPQNEPARERLVELYKEAGDIERAMEQQNVLVSAATTPEAKCQRTVELAGIHEAAGDAKKAESTLVQARKQFPKNHVALMALVSFYQRSDQAQAASVLLDRAAADSRRALGTGRFEEFLFATLATVAELRGRADAAAIAQATVASLRGEPAAFDGAGRAAGDASLDELIAPDLMSPAFRELLTRTGPMLDTAVPYDMGGVRAKPLPGGDLADIITGMAAGYGLGPVQAHVSSVLGSVCIAASAHPPTLVMGESLVASDETDVRAFLIHRALKVIQGNATVFARTAPIDLWPLLAAYLKTFNQSWSPQGVDAARLTDAYGKLSRAMPSSPDPQVPLLAAEVIGAVGNRASTLNTVINGWGDRAGLLAMGDPSMALRGIALAGDHTNAPPPSGSERLKWVGRNAEARELIVFSVSEAYADARARLGL